MTSTELDHNDHNEKLAVEEKEKLEWVTPSAKNQVLRPPDHNKKPSVARDPREDQNSSTAENNENDTPNTASRPWFAP